MKKIWMGITLALVSSSAAFAVDVAKVNGRAITDKDLHMALGNLSEAQRHNVLKDVGTRRQVVESVIDQELLVIEGEKQKLDQDAEFKDALNAFKKQYLTSRVLQKNLGNKLTDSAAKKFYEAHKNRYSTDQVHAMHILVNTETEAQDLIKKTKGMSNDDFQSLAEKTSKDPSAKNNRGDLGFFGRDRMVPEFTEAAFAGENGSVVGPVKTDYGYHVIKVIEKKIGKPLPFADVEMKVKSDLRQELTRNYVGDLKKQAKVQVDDKAIEKL